jgi:hypothetical protein
VTMACKARDRASKLRVLFVDVMCNQRAAHKQWNNSTQDAQHARQCGSWFKRIINAKETSWAAKACRSRVELATCHDMHACHSSVRSRCFEPMTFAVACILCVNISCGLHASRGTPHHEMGTTLSIGQTKGRPSNASHVTDPFFVACI